LPSMLLNGKAVIPQGIGPVSPLSHSFAKFESRSGLLVHSFVAPFGARMRSQSAPCCCRAANGAAFDLSSVNGKSWQSYSVSRQVLLVVVLPNFCMDQSASDRCLSLFEGF